MPAKKIAIVGTVGVPANYGGFETLAENLVRYHSVMSLSDQITVYCSGRDYSSRKQGFLSAKLKYIPFNANGVQSIPYDIVSLVSAIWNRNDVIFLLGVSGAIALPFVRFFSSARIIVNIDGIEWRRAKWQGLARWFLRFSEKMAVRFSHVVISDNDAIARYVMKTYGLESHVIAYGGDHAMVVEATVMGKYDLPERYAFSVCRIEPENNVHIILEAFSELDAHPLVMVGNWHYSEYGQRLRDRYADVKHLFLLDPVYDVGKLKMLRSRAFIYVHGHSAGGTNPSLVEAMHFGGVVLAFDCDYNRCTTEEKALFFRDGAELQRLVKSLDGAMIEKIGQDMLEIARRRYTWDIVARQYFSLMDV